MMSLIRAEYLKIVKNKKFANFLLWTYPIASFAVIFFALIIAIVVKGDGVDFSQSSWRSDFRTLWLLINVFPENIFGRVMPLAYFAFIFASEYQWGTWKNVVPRSKRPQILTAKLIAGVFLLMFALFISSVVIWIMMLIGMKIQGLSFSPHPTAEVTWEFVKIYLSDAGIVLITLVIWASIVNLVAVFSRSILATLLIGLGLNLADTFVAVWLELYVWLFDQPNIVNLFRYSINYNIENIRSYLISPNPFFIYPNGFSSELTPAVSFVILLIWFAIIFGSAIIKFHRSDITE